METIDAVKLPAKRNQKTDLKEWLENLQAFTAKLNQAVKEGDLKAHHIVEGARYLPISKIEMKLDELFFGLWKTKKFRWKQIENEIVAAIDVYVYHPFAEMWLTRTGASGTQIMVNIPKDDKNDQVKKNAASLDMKNKKPTALSMGMFAALKAECFTNGCLSLGKSLGRDVNRDVVAQYDRLLKDTGDDRETQEARQELSDAIQLCQVDKLKQKIIESTLAGETEGKADLAFYQTQLKRLEK